MPCLCHCFLFNLRHLFLFIVFMIAMSPLHCFSTDQQPSSETLRLLSAYIGGTKHFIENPDKKNDLDCVFSIDRRFFHCVSKKNNKGLAKGQDGQSNQQHADSQKNVVFFHFGRVNFNHVPRKLPSKRYWSHPKTSPEPSLVRRNIKTKKKCPQRFLPPKKMAGMCFFCVQMPDGCSPLFAAAACNHLDVVKYLLCAGADKDSLLWDRPYWIKDHQIFHFWGIKQCKWMVILRAFPLVVHCLGWKYNDPFECY